MRRILTQYQKGVASIALEAFGTEAVFDSTELSQAFGKTVPGGVIGALKRSKVFLEVDDRYPARYRFHPDYVRDVKTSGVTT